MFCFSSDETWFEDDDLGGAIDDEDIEVIICGFYVYNPQKKCRTLSMDSIIETIDCTLSLCKKQLESICDNRSVKSVTFSTVNSVQSGNSSISISVDVHVNGQVCESESSPSQNLPSVNENCDNNVPKETTDHTYSAENTQETCVSNRTSNQRPIALRERTSKRTDSGFDDSGIGLDSENDFIFSDDENNDSTTNSPVKSKGKFSTSTKETIKSPNGKVISYWGQGKKKKDSDWSPWP